MIRQFLVAAGLAVLAVAALPGAASAQTVPAKWPPMCVCKSSDPNAFTTHYLTVRTDGDLTALKAGMAAVDYTPVGKTIALPSLCPIPKMCTDQDKLAVDDANFRLKVLGFIADDGLVVDGKIQAGKFGPGAFLVLSGQKE
jgi:hypothetical protein